ncbi:MAG: hypothetical protein WC298_00655 [Sideroxydans sp.]
MKLNKFALTLTAAALLPTFAFAGTDQVAASFERDLQRGMSIESVAVAKTETSDPLVNAINVALNGSSDQVLVSFERDLHRDPTITPAILVAKAADPLVNAIDVALYGSSDQVLASFERDLYRVPTVSGVVLTASVEVDPLATAINVALWSETGKPATNVATAGGHRHGS